MFYLMLCLIFSIWISDKAQDNSESASNQSKQQQQWVVMKDPPEIIKDGISELSKDNPLAYEHIEKMSSVLPTMWMGAQNGRLVDKYFQYI